MEQWWNYTGRGKPKYPQQNLSQCPFVYYNLTRSSLGLNPRLHSETWGIKRLGKKLESLRQ